jgi:hypothetical protein
MRFSSSAVAVVLLIATLARPAGSQTAGVTGAAISPADLRLRLFAIADDSMGGRRSGSAGNSKTADYMAAEFRRLGLQPAGEGGTWFQTVPFFYAEPGSRTLAVGAAALTFGTDYVLIGGGSRAAAGWRVRGIRWSRERSIELDQRRSGRREGGGAGRAPGGRRTTTQVQRLRAVVTDPRFARAAALAVAELDLFPPAVVTQIAVGRSRPTRAARAVSPPPAHHPGAAEALLGAPAGLAPGASGRTVRGEVGARFTPVPFPARNVIAVLPGRDPALRGRYVALTAHNDHVGFAPARWTTIRSGHTTRSCGRWAPIHRTARRRRRSSACQPAARQSAAPASRAARLHPQRRG